MTHYKVDGTSVASGEILMECSGCGPLGLCANMQAAREVAVRHLTEHGAQLKEQPDE